MFGNAGRLVGLAIALVAGTLGLAGTATAEPRFGLEPGTFFAKTHEVVPLVPNPDASPFDPPNRSVVADLAGLTGADPVTQAGAHPDGSTSFKLIRREPPFDGSPAGYAKDVLIDLPAGFIGNPRAATECTRDLITQGSGQCPPSAQVGVATVDLTSGQETQTVPVYRITPAFGFPAAFGFKIVNQLIVLAPRLRSESDYGISVEARTISSNPYVLRSATVTIWGVPAEGDAPGQGHFDDRWDNSVADWGVAAGIARRPFWINPSRCDTGPLATRISMHSWQQPQRWLPEGLDPADPANGTSEDYVSWSPEPTGCGLMPPFEGELNMQPASREAGQPTGFQADLSLPYNDDPDGIATPYLKKAEVLLPEGVTVSPSAANGLDACTDRQAGFGTEREVNCPSASKIGTVSVLTPLLEEPVPGDVYIAAPTDDQLLRVFIIFQDERRGLTIRVAGDVDTDPDTGQVTAVFDENPQLPFTDMNIQFDAGPLASLVNPLECGIHTTVTRLTAWNGDVTESRSSFRISADGRGGSCPSSRPFDPWLTGGTVNPVAGEYSPFVLRFGREDVEQEIDSIGVQMPPGLVAKIAGVELCPSDRADAGTCGDGSRIGHTQIASGAGTQPFWVPGPGKDATSVFLSGPYRGAPYSLSIVVPAQAGPFDLGRVVVRAPISVDERTADLSVGIAESRVYDRFGSLDGVVAGRMPTVLEGIPLKVKEIRVIVDRDQFMLNPTNCSPKQIRAQIGSAQGESAQVSEHFQAADCAALPFQPRFVARVMDTGRRSTMRSFNPRMRFTVLPRPGDANMGPTQVILPPAVILDQGNIKTTCTRAQFAERACPQRAIYGFARAWSPLLDRPVRGPVYMASNGGARLLPDLVADLDGPVRIVLRGWVDSAKGGRLRNTFKVVPDVPVSRFDLTMFGGRNRGLLVNSTDLCRDRTRGVARFFGANGKRSVQRPPVRLRYKGCKRVRQKAKRNVAKRKVARQAVKRQAARGVTD